MNCPNCGAALSPLPNRSHFSCDYCKSLHFPQPVVDGVVLLDRDHEFTCPCCERVLAAAILDGGDVGHCRKCHGILLASDHFAQVIARRREDNERRKTFVEPIDPTEFRRMIRCPRCRNRTDTHAYGGGGNAVIDSCARCKLVWLDAGELTVLQEFGVCR